MKVNEKDPFGKLKTITTYTTTSYPLLHLSIEKIMEDIGYEATIKTVDTLLGLYKEKESNDTSEELFIFVLPEDDTPSCIRAFVFMNEIMRSNNYSKCNFPCIILGGGERHRTLQKDYKDIFIPWREDILKIQKSISGILDKWSIYQFNEFIGLIKKLPFSRLNDHQLMILCYTLEGLTMKEISLISGRKLKTIWSQRKKSMDKIGVSDIRDLNFYFRNN